jgi:TonB family protein
MKILAFISLSIILLSSKVFAQVVDKPVDSLTYGIVQNNYIGGQDAYDKYLDAHGHYPEVAKSNNIQGCALIRFVIEKDSTLNNIEIYSGIGSGMDEEALRLIKQSGKWIPNNIKGVNYRTWCIVPVQFLLEQDANKSGINGETRNPDRLGAFWKIESNGIPVSYAVDYIGQRVRFVGKIYEAKAVSDSVFVLTCANIQYGYSMKYVNVVLQGKDIFAKKPKMEELNNRIIIGLGTVGYVKRTPIIAIDDIKDYQILTQEADPNYTPGRR